MGADTCFFGSGKVESSQVVPAIAPDQQDNKNKNIASVQDKRTTPEQFGDVPCLLPGHGYGFHPPGISGLARLIVARACSPPQDSGSHSVLLSDSGVVGSDDDTDAGGDAMPKYVSGDPLPPSMPPAHSADMMHSTPVDCCVHDLPHDTQASSVTSSLDGNFAGTKDNGGFNEVGKHDEMASAVVAATVDGGFVVVSKGDTMTAPPERTVFFAEVSARADCHLGDSYSFAMASVDGYQKEETPVLVAVPSTLWADCIYGSAVFAEHLNNTTVLTQPVATKNATIKAGSRVVASEDGIFKASLTGVAVMRDTVCPSFIPILRYKACE